MKGCVLLFTLACTYRLVHSQDTAGDAAAALMNMMGGGGDGPGLGGGGVGGGNIGGGMGGGGDMGGGMGAGMGEAADSARSVGLAEPTFTQQDLERMYLGTKQGVRYNLRGQPAVPGEATLSIAVIEALLDMRHSNVRASTPRFGFTLDQVEAMLLAMAAGVKYNVQGQPAAPGETTILRIQLLAYRDWLLAGAGMPANTFANMPVESLREILSSIDTTGMAYNILGQPAQPGQLTVTRDYIIWLINRKAGSGSTSGPRMNLHEFTFDALQTMLANIRNGSYYTISGRPASAGDSNLLTEEMLQKNARSLNLGSFTDESLRTMLEAIRGGAFFNRSGQPASAGDPDLLSERDMQNFINFRRALTLDLGANITLADLQTMLAAIRNGAFYDTNGQPATAESPNLLSPSMLQQYIYHFRDQSGGGGNVQTKDFTYLELEAILNGIKAGLQYNFNGLPAAEGEVTLTLDMVTDMMTRLQAMGMGGPGKPAGGNEGIVQMRLKGA
ncbi:hypothetical protein MAR_007497 [Mya arenaria]|uniref:Uncharacterized protein n=1 Tax=Mya arenaria TaxID=6604 RepID=A0ABY7DBH1_MYAAR|nr:hypothetical protein MAR_007497 [Mya arenaria]